MLGHIVWGGCALIGILLVTRGFAGTRRADYATRYRTLESYQMVPKRFLWHLVCVLPPVEALLGGRLITRDPDGVYSVLVAALMLVFATGAARALRSGDTADAGARSSPGPLVYLVRRNTVLAAFLFLAGTAGRSYGWLREPGFDPRVLAEALMVCGWFAVEWAMSASTRRGKR